MTHLNWETVPQMLPSQTANLLFLQRKIALERATELSPKTLDIIDRVDITDTEDLF